MGTLTSPALKERARQLGFELCGIAPARTSPEASAFLRSWLDRGYHGQMEYMARTAERRADVLKVLPTAESVVVLGTVYNTLAPSSLERSHRLAALISRYAWGEDYHDVLGRRLNALVAWMQRESTDELDVKAYVDTGPVLERAFAERAGLGWIGKNTCLINPSLGSWLFLCEIVCSAVLEPDAPALDQCGTCSLCLEACPTNAFVDAHALDATRCISYLTIELKERIPVELREQVGQHVYGCDICQEVCPWNGTSIAATTTDPAWRPRAVFDRADLLRLWRLSDADLRNAIRGTPMTRARVRRLRRNLAVAIGNCGDPDAAAVFDEPIDAPSADDPLVREHVEWAKERLRAHGGAGLTRA